MKILMVLTSHENLDNTGLKTGFWLEALRHVKSADGKPAVYERSVTGFANTEEQSVGLTRVVRYRADALN